MRAWTLIIAVVVLSGCGKAPVTPGGSQVLNQTITSSQGPLAPGTLYRTQTCTKTVQMTGPLLAELQFCSSQFENITISTANIIVTCNVSYTIGSPIQFSCTTNEPDFIEVNYVVTPGTADTLGSASSSSVINYNCKSPVSGLAPGLLVSSSPNPTFDSCNTTLDLLPGQP